MRYRGGGVGHKSTREATNHFLKDRRPEDLKRNMPMNSEDENEETGGEEEEVEEETQSPEGGAALQDDSESDEEPQDQFIDEGLFQEECDYEYGLGDPFTEKDVSESDSDGGGNDSDLGGDDSADDALGAEDGCGTDEMDECGYAEL